MTDILIRPESNDDVAGIRHVNIEAFREHPFSHQTEHLIVDALRDAGALTLSLVAERDGEIVGHIAFSQATVGESALGWFLLGPVAVLPGLQRDGIGSALVEAGLAELRAAGAKGCVLVGDAGFYGRFGFAAAPGLAYEGVPGEYVLGLAFAEEQPRGVIRAHKAFELDAES